MTNAMNAMNAAASRDRLYVFALAGRFWGGKAVLNEPANMRLNGLSYQALGSLR